MPSGAVERTRVAAFAHRCLGSLPSWLHRLLFHFRPDLLVDLLPQHLGDHSRKAPIVHVVPVPPLVTLSDEPLAEKSKSACTFTMIAGRRNVHFTMTLTYSRRRANNGCGNCVQGSAQRWASATKRSRRCLCSIAMHRHFAWEPQSEALHGYFPENHGLTSAPIVAITSRRMTAPMKVQGRDRAPVPVRVGARARSEPVLSRGRSPWTLISILSEPRISRRELDL